MNNIIVHPIDYRYGSEDLRKVFSVENFYRKMALVELAVVKVQEKYGLVPKGTSKALEEAINSLNIEEVFEEEKIVKHDIMALIKVLARKMGELGEYIHIGLTSADLRDTAKILLILEGLQFIKKLLDELILVLAKLAKKYIDLPCVARTHGVHANIYSLGRKFAVFAYEFLRHRRRILDAEKRLKVGKASGGVGIHVALGELGEKIEREALKTLGLEPDISATQVISRDVFAEIFLVLIMLSSSLDKLATEIRNLQRTEIAELEEEFTKQQVGSTAMPHKKNPINAENISSLARILRGLSVPILENIVLWHERDLTNSASERIIIPEIFLLLEEQLRRAIRILKKIRINKQKILENLELTKGMILSEVITTKLALAGMGRQRAHEHIRKIALKAYEQEKSFKELIMDDKIVKLYIEDIDSLFDYKSHLIIAIKRTKKIISIIEQELGAINY